MIEVDDIFKATITIQDNNEWFVYDLSESAYYRSGGLVCFIGKCKNNAKYSYKYEDVTINYKYEPKGGPRVVVKSNTFKGDVYTHNGMTFIICKGKLEEE